CLHLCDRQAVVRPLCHGHERVAEAGSGAGLGDETRFTVSELTTSSSTPTVVNQAIGSRRIDEYLKEVLSKNGSDLHFIAGDMPRIRLYGELHVLRQEILEPQFVEEVLHEIMPRAAQQRLEEKHGADFAYIIPGVSRFRVNVMRHLYGLGAVCRAIPSKALTLDELNMPDAVRNLCKVNNGLILVTGKTGSGKSTTLAAMIDDINTRRQAHIRRMGDPIVFVHPRKNCHLSRREFGTASPALAQALQSSLREAPCGILVGVLRDCETMG